jgi:hypothetical protein
MCPILDREGLNEEFNMAEPEVVEAEPVDDFELEWERDNDTVQGLKSNIERANEILDKVQDEIEHGNFTARLVEVAGQLINSITIASKEILEKEYKDKYLGLRQQIVLLKKREVDIRALSSNRPKNQNLIVASREDVLKLLREGDSTESDSENEQKLLNQ